MLWGRSPEFKPHYPQNFTKRFHRTLAIFEECPIEGTSFKLHYTVFIGYLQCDRLLRADGSVINWFNAFSEVILGKFELFTLVLLA